MSALVGSAPASLVVQGPVPQTLGPAATRAGAHEVLDRQILLRAPGLARALVDASGATVDAEPGASAEAVSWFAERHVRTARRLAAGKFTLWASSVVVDGSGLALVSEEGAGKSTIAASLALRGFPVLSDHALDVEFDHETAVAVATGDGLELWPASARALGLEPDTGEPVRAGLAKHVYRFPTARAAPLRTVVVLVNPIQAEIELDRLTRGRAILALTEATCMAGIVEAAGLRSAHFMWLTRLSEAAKVVLVRTSHFESEIAAVSDAVLAEATW